MERCTGSEKPLKVLIIGCGNIAGKFDMLNASNTYAQTHAGAYLKNINFTLSACVEPDQSCREEFMEYWKIDKGFASLLEAINSTIEFDIISICSPTDQHENDILLAIKLTPKIIFCEKPIAPSLHSSKAVALACENSNIPLAVNYSRRWDPVLDDFSKALNNGEYGVLRSVVGTYNKGVLNNGSHLIDLLQLLLGDLTISSIGQVTDDYLDEDPSISATLLTNNGVAINLVTGNALDYSLFEVQFIFEKAMVTMQGGGARWCIRKRIESELYAGYYALNSGESKKGGYTMAMENAIENIHSYITSGNMMLSTAENSLSAQSLCEGLKQSVALPSKCADSKNNV
jgi:predicted dehydrogenase